MRITYRMAITMLILCLIPTWIPVFTEGFPLIDVVAYGTVVVTLVGGECYDRYGPGFALIDLLPRLKTVGFPRHRTARLGVSGLQSWSTRPDCWRGQAAVTPIPAWDSELPCVGIHTQRPEGDSLGRGVARIPILSVYVGGEIRLGVVVYTFRLYIKLPASTVP